MSDAQPRPLPRREIIEEAKQMVLYHGPSIVLDHGRGLIEDYGVTEKFGDETASDILDEARKQAVRVYAFLGFDPPR